MDPLHKRVFESLKKTRLYDISRVHIYPYVVFSPHKIDFYQQKYENDLYTVFYYRNDIVTWFFRKIKWEKIEQVRKIAGAQRVQFVERAQFSRIGQDPI